MTAPAPKLAPDGLTCAKCGYLLLGQPIASDCPECGYSIAQSLNPAGFSAFDPHWLKRQHRGYLVLLAAILIFALAWVCEAVIRWQIVYHGLVSPLVFARQGSVITSTMVFLAPVFLAVILVLKKSCPDKKHTGIGPVLMGVLILVAGLGSIWSLIQVIHLLKFLPNPKTGTLLDHSAFFNDMNYPLVSTMLLLEAAFMAFSSKRLMVIRVFMLLIPIGIAFLVAGYLTDDLAGERIFNQRGPNPNNGADATCAALACTPYALLGLFYLLSLPPISLLRREIQSGITHNTPATPASPANPKA
jgi:hypothetical protein